VLRIRTSGKPVVVSMGDVAASGGYYIASAATEIFAGNGTLTGSIGVIIQATDMSQLFGKIGLRPETIKSGKFKDMFSPNRPLTEEERRLAKSMILDIYDQFVDDVREGRKHRGLTRHQLMAVADGRVMTGRQAMKAKLVDRIGGLEDAINEAGRLGGITGRPNVWRVKRSFWQVLAEAASNVRPVVNINLGGSGESQAAEQLLGPAR
jgi:protease-4